MAKPRIIRSASQKDKDTKHHIDCHVNARRLRVRAVAMGFIAMAYCGLVVRRYKVMTHGGDEVDGYRLWGCNEYNCPVCDYYSNKKYGERLLQVVRARKEKGLVRAFLRVILTFPDPLRKKLDEVLRHDKKRFQKVMSACVRLFYNRALRLENKHTHKREGSGFWFFHYLGDRFSWHPHNEVYAERDHFPKIDSGTLDKWRDIWKSCLEEVFKVRVQGNVVVNARYFMLKRWRQFARAIMYGTRSMMVKADMDVDALTEEQVRNIFEYREMTKGMHRRQGFGEYRKYLESVEKTLDQDDDDVDWRTARPDETFYIQGFQKVSGQWVVRLKERITGRKLWLGMKEINWYPLRR